MLPRSRRRIIDDRPGQRCGTFARIIFHPNVLYYTCTYFPAGRSKSTSNNIYDTPGDRVVFFFCFVKNFIDVHMRRIDVYLYLFPLLLKKQQQ